jgi:hypothetical protein
MGLQVEAHWIPGLFSGIFPRMGYAYLSCLRVQTHSNEQVVPRLKSLKRKRVFCNQHVVYVYWVRLEKWTSKFETFSPMCLDFLFNLSQTIKKFHHIQLAYILCSLCRSLYAKSFLLNHNKIVCFSSISFLFFLFGSWANHIWSKMSTLCSKKKLAHEIFIFKTFASSQHPPIQHLHHTKHLKVCIFFLLCMVFLLIIYNSKVVVRIQLGFFLLKRVEEN